MIKMKKYVVMFCAMLATGLIATSCSSDEDAVQSVAEGKGQVKVAVNVGTEFQSRAINESTYSSLANYTVQILKDGTVVSGCEWKGNAIPQDLIELDNGSYTLIAFTGDAYKGVGATTQGMYVEGSAEFSVNSDQVANATVTCVPQCARVTISFDDEMDTYFNDYYVTLSGTQALGQSTFTWAKTNTDPVYLAMTGTETVTATINLVDKEGKVATPVIRTKSLSAAKAWKLNIAPVVESGNLGITITVDDSTNDIPIDIEIPAEWL